MEDSGLAQSTMLATIEEEVTPSEIEVWFREGHASPDDDCTSSSDQSLASHSDSGHPVLNPDHLFEAMGLEVVEVPGFGQAIVEVIAVIQAEASSDGSSVRLEGSESDVSEFSAAASDVDAMPPLEEVEPPGVLVPIQDVLVPQHPGCLH